MPATFPPPRTPLTQPPARQIYFNYGSQKPFEHLVKEQQREERAKREKEQLQNVVNYQWVRLAAVDCRSTRSPVPSPPLPRVLQVPNKVSD